MYVYIKYRWCLCVKETPFTLFPLEIKAFKMRRLRYNSVLFVLFFLHLDGWRPVEVLEVWFERRLNEGGGRPAAQAAAAATAAARAAALAGRAARGLVEPEKVLLGQNSL